MGCHCLLRIYPLLYSKAPATQRETVTSGSRGREALSQDSSLDLFFSSSCHEPRGEKDHGLSQSARPRLKSNCHPECLSSLPCVRGCVSILRVVSMKRGREGRETHPWKVQCREEGKQKCPRPTGLGFSRTDSHLILKDLGSTMYICQSQSHTTPNPPLPLASSSLLDRLIFTLNEPQA